MNSTGPFRSTLAPLLASAGLVVAAWTLAVLVRG